MTVIITNLATFHPQIPLVIYWWICNAMSWRYMPSQKFSDIRSMACEEHVEAYFEHLDLQTAPGTTNWNAVWQMLKIYGV